MANGFVVFADSQAVIEHRGSAKGIKTQREELLAKGFLVNEDECLVFTRDIEFGSPSAAGAIIQGGNVNGLICWKNSDKLSLKEIEKNQT